MMMAAAIASSVLAIGETSYQQKRAEEAERFKEGQEEFANIQNNIALTDKMMYVLSKQRAMAGVSGTDAASTTFKMINAESYSKYEHDKVINDLNTKWQIQSQQQQLRNEEHAQWAQLGSKIFSQAASAYMMGGYGQASPTTETQSLLSYNSPKNSPQSIENFSRSQFNSLNLAL